MKGSGDSIIATLFVVVVVVLHLVVGLVPEHQVHGVAGEGQEGHVDVATDLQPVAVVIHTLGINGLNMIILEGNDKIQTFYSTFSLFISVIS